MFKQLSFSKLIPEQKDLNDFQWGENALLKFHLEKIIQSPDDKFVYIWGAAGSGKSHLLQTLCHQYDADYSSIYLPLSLADELTPMALENLESQHIVTIDDIHLIKQNLAWEEAIFHLYNRIRDAKNSLLVISGNKPPSQLGLQLADLSSRLQWGLTWHLKELQDASKIDILTQAAAKKGFVLPTPVVQYLLTHHNRNLHYLMQLIDYLDNASLQAQRKIITIPFVKSCLNDFSKNA